MASQNPGGALFSGRKNQYCTADYIGFYLCDATGAPYTGGVLGTNVKATLYLPDGTTWAIDQNSPPAGTLSLGSAGFYRLALWGDGAANGHDIALKQLGNNSVRIYPAATEFAPFAMNYEVTNRWNVIIGLTYVAGSGGTDQLTGCLAFQRWETSVHMFSPLTATNRPVGAGMISGANAVLTGLTFKLTDKDSSSNILSLTASDFTENTFDGNLYFTKTVTGIAGARVLSSRTAFTFAGNAFEVTQVHPVRFGA